MSFPIINYRYNKLEEAQSLTDIVDQKLASLEKYIQNEISNCDVEFQKVAAQQNGKVCRIEVNLVIDGTLFRAEATEESFEEAVDEVRDELDKELRRAKGKQAAVDKQAGRAVKEQLQEDADS